MYFILLMSKKHPSGYLSFSGKLENASDSVMYISGYGLRKKIMVNEHGFFSDSLVVEKPNLYTLSLGSSKNKGKVYFKNGYDLYVTIDATILVLESRRILLGLLGMDSDLLYHFMSPYLLRNL